jgi:hypothetical protein
MVMPSAHGIFICVKSIVWVASVITSLHITKVRTIKLDKLWLIRTTSRLSYNSDTNILFILLFSNILLMVYVGRYTQLELYVYALVLR